MVKWVNKCYELSAITSSKGHTVIHLPPYMSTYNSIELICTKVKREVAKKNKTLRWSTLSNSARYIISLVKQWHDEHFAKEIARAKILNKTTTYWMTLTQTKVKGSLNLCPVSKVTWQHLLVWLCTAWPNWNQPKSRQLSAQPTLWHSILLTGFYPSFMRNGTIP